MERRREISFPHRSSAWLLKPRCDATVRWRPRAVVVLVGVDSALWTSCRPLAAQARNGGAVAAADPEKELRSSAPSVSAVDGAIGEAPPVTTRLCRSRRR